MNKKKVAFLLRTLLSLVSYFFTDIPMRVLLIGSLVLGGVLLLILPLIGPDAFSLDGLVEKGVEKREKSEEEALRKVREERKELVTPSPSPKK